MKEKEKIYGGYILQKGDNDKKGIYGGKSVGKDLGYIGELQNDLLALKYNLPKYGADKDFGTETEEAVKRFQQKSGLVENGKVDSNTALAIKKGKKVPVEPPKIETPPAKPPISAPIKIEPDKSLYEPYDAYYLLKPGDSGEHVYRLQTALKRLGFLGHNDIKQVNGNFGKGGYTERAIRALQYDLINKRIRGKDWNQGRIKEVNGIVDQNLALIIKTMLGASDEEFFKVPYTKDRNEANKKAIQLLDEQENKIISQSVPPTFIKAILKQETGMAHYDVDGFVYIGCDEVSPLYVYKSRGWGMGQYTITHHPPTLKEADEFINNPVNNVDKAVKELREKFDRYIVSNSLKQCADERIKIRGKSSLIECKYKKDSPMYIKDCMNCVKNAKREDEYYGELKWHKSTHKNVPVWSDIPCDWPVAIRRYNGSGPNSYAYRAEVLWQILGKDIR
ncbi:MAG: peptidoglycan-binding protein [Nitrospirota bacterium]